MRAKQSAPDGPMDARVIARWARTAPPGPRGHVFWNIWHATSDAEQQAFLERFRRLERLGDPPD